MKNTTVTTLSFVENKANCIFMDASKYTRFMKRVKSMSCLVTLLSLIMLTGCGPNQKELTKIANSQYETTNARVAAIKKLTDKDAVGGIVDDPRNDFDVRSAAQERLRELINQGKSSQEKEAENREREAEDRAKARAKAQAKAQPSVAEAASANFHASVAAAAGNTAEALEHYTAAEKALTQATILDPDNANCWVDLAIARVRINDKSGAKTALKKVISICNANFAKDPQNLTWLIQQIRPLIMLGRIDDARALLDKAVKQFPDNAQVRRIKDMKIIDQLLADPQIKDFSV